MNLCSIGNETDLTILYQLSEMFISFPPVSFIDNLFNLSNNGRWFECNSAIIGDSCLCPRIVECRAYGREIWHPIDHPVASHPQLCAKHYDLI
jgi:hypothetical protein